MQSTSVHSSHLNTISFAEAGLTCLKALAAGDAASMVLAVFSNVYPDHSNSVHMKIERSKISSHFPSSLLNNAKLIQYRWETLLFAQFILLKVMKNHPVTERKRLVYNSAPWANSFSLRSPMQILFILPYYDCNLSQLHVQKSWQLHASLITFCSFGSCISDSIWPVFQLNMGDVFSS